MSLTDRLKNIYIYNELNEDDININEIVVYIKNILKKSDIEICGCLIDNFISDFDDGEKEQVIYETARKIAGTKIRNTEQNTGKIKPFPVEIDYEIKRIKEKKQRLSGLVYDGLELSSLYSDFVSPSRFNDNSGHIILTNQFIGSWDDDDLRFHLRAAIYNYITIISIPGIIEAPAKPRDFYIKRQLGIDIIELKKEFHDRFLEYKDNRLTEIVKGYIIQSVMYYLTGNPFCEDKNCRLFNAHWQEELIHAQLEGEYEFCEKHSSILGNIK